MAKFYRGDMVAGLGLLDKPVVLLCTTNAALTHERKLVMGRGAAEEFKRYFPGCDAQFGLMVSKLGSNYGVLVYQYQFQIAIGAFQVKCHWLEAATLSLIVASTSILDRLAREVWSNWEIRLNFPGIGNGGLDIKDVKPLLLGLPDNVTIWRY